MYNGFHWLYLELYGDAGGLYNMNSGADTELMETEVGNPAGPREFLAAARQFVDQGKPSEALQAMVMATRTQGGDQAVFQFLSRARKLYSRRIQETADIDQLASLFAECAIAEAQPLILDPSATHMASSDPSITPDAHGTSILAETGRMQIVLDAFADGSSFICLQCGGLVTVHRKDEHYAYWCSNM